MGGVLFSEWTSGSGARSERRGRRVLGARSKEDVLVMNAAGGEWTCGDEYLPIVRALNWRRVRGRRAREDGEHSLWEGECV